MLAPDAAEMCHSPAGNEGPEGDTSRVALALGAEQASLAGILGPAQPRPRGCEVEGTD